MLKTTLMLVSVGAVGTSLLTGRLVSGSAVSDHKDADLKVSADNARQLEVKVPIGKVTVIADGSRELHVHVVRSAKGPNDETSRRWLNDSYLTAENKNGVLVVRDHPFGRESFSEYKSLDESGKGQRSRSLDLDVQIHVPSELAARLNVSAGEADIAGRYRSMDAQVSAGTLTADRLRTDGSVSLKVGAGSLVAGIPSGSRSTNQISVGVGEVKLRIPGGSGADVSADVAMGEITGLPGKEKKEGDMHFGDKRHGRSGNGEAKVHVHVGTGSIAIDSEGRVEASTMPEEGGDNHFSFNDDDAGVKFQFDGNLDSTVEKAMQAASEAMASANFDVKLDDNDFDLKGMDLELKSQDKANEQELKKANEEIRRAMKQVEESMRKIRPEMEKQMRASKPEIEREMKLAQEEVAKAMRDMKPEMERAIKEMKPEIERAMKQAREEMAKSAKEMKLIKPEIEKAIREAMEELKRALKEMKLEGNVKA